MEGILDKVSFLARSKYRVWLLEHLSENEQLTWEELRSECSASRATLQRNLDALQSRNWIRTVDARTYTLTVAGRAVIENFSEFIDTMSATERLHPFLRWFPAEKLDLDIRLLADAEVTTSDPSNPYAPVNKQISAMESADVFRWLLPAVGPQLIRVMHDCVVEYHEKHEVVVDPTVAELMKSPSDYAHFVDDLLTSDHCEIRIAETNVPFYLGLTEEIIQVGTRNDDGIHQALVETTNEEVREWAERTYEKYERRADELKVNQTSEVP